MTASVAAALITAFISLILALGKIVVDLREKSRERTQAARERLDRYRAPLLSAVDEVGRRLNNIRHDDFMAYLDDTARRETAVLSTLYRFAQYFAWIEIVYGYADRLRFESDSSTKAVARALGDVAWTLAVDEFDRTDPLDFRSSRWMLWREEQRAIGELMLTEGEEVGCIGFATFALRYDAQFAQWFSRFSSDLYELRASDSMRFAQLQRIAVEAARELDVDRILVELGESGDVVNPRWARPEAVEAATRGGR